ncbi:hypothetical protein J4422_03270 [Candidatus Pacearchaeota archaeon]|nr:hypothetical protein [Candidatus Pacearchaeota archaeon]
MAIRMDEGIVAETYSIGPLTDRETYELARRVCWLDETPIRGLRGKIELTYSGFGLLLERGEKFDLGSFVNNEEINNFINEVIEHEKDTWQIHGNELRIEEYENRTNFTFLWPKGDGYRYQIADLSKIPEEKVKRDLALIRLFCTGFTHGFSLGYLKSAYKTKNNLSVFEFYYESGD